MKSEPSASTGWSVVMIAWDSECRDRERVSAVAQDFLARKGLDVLHLTLHTKEHLPAELAADLSKERANELVARLSETGAVGEATLTAAVTGVKHRASEVWASRCTDTHCFTEVDGLVIASPAIMARRLVGQWRTAHPDIVQWEMEHLLNHQHLFPGKQSYNECIAEAVQVAGELRSTLREAYPERAFTIAYDTGIVSFWQATPESPSEEYLCRGEEATDKGWCLKCESMRPIRKTSKVDPRFVKAQWGFCEECGDEVMVTDCCKLTFIGPTEDDCK